MKVSVQENEEGQPEVKVTSSGTNSAMEPDEQAAAPAEASASEPKRSEFAAVVFDQTAETYPEDANVECCYTLTTDIKPSSRDWIGLFKVGWLSPRDYLYYEWAALPPQYEAGKEAEAKVVFPAARLPKDDAEFYQFCYVSSTSSIRGASTPFQFKRPSADDFVELDDPDEEMRIILPMSSHLTQQVTKYKMLASSLEAERDRLSAKLSKAHSKAEQCSNEASKLRRKLDDSTAALRDMTMAHDEVKSRLEMFEKERERLDDQVLQEEQKVAQCLETIRALEAERDELAGHCSSLKSEVSTYRNTILDLESQVRSATTQLQQTEDQLQATQERKVMMEREMEAYREAQAKLSNDLEIAFGQNHAFKEQMQQMEVGFSDEMKLMRNEQLQKDHDIEALRQKLELVEQEKFALRKQLDDVERSAYVSQEAAASLFALQKANDALKARHDKMSSALEEKEKELATLKRQSRHKERELYRAAEDDRQRVEMCKAEYKMVLAENSKLRHKLLKYLNRKTDGALGTYASQEEKATETSAAIRNTVACQQAVQMVNAANDASSVASTNDAGTDTDSVSTPSPSPPTSTMDALAWERARHKKDKYKRLYLEEKEKGDMLRCQYDEEIQKKDFELERIRRHAAEEKDELNQRILNLENCLAVKDQHIEGLYTEMRDAKVERHVAGACPPPPPPPPVSYNALEREEARLVHGNPYGNRGAAVYYRPTTEEEMYSEEQTCEEERAACSCCYHTRNVQPSLQTGSESEARPFNLENPISSGLPPPLLPEVLPEARMAAERQQLGIQAALENDDQLFEDCAGYAGAMPSAPSAAEHQEDERFMDAIGEGMKICPVCEMHIATMSDAEFAEHIVSHFGRLCPVCKIQADDTMSKEEFEAHVNKCCETARNSRAQ